MEDNHFVIISPFYNAGSFLEGCVNSILTQKYSNFKVIFIDDASTDGCTDVEWFKNLKFDSRVISIKNSVNLTALENIHNCIMNYCNPNDIVCLVDGDDKLSNRNVLSHLNEEYKKYDPWCLYGSSKWSDGRSCISRPYTENDFKNNIRLAPLKISHLRTFRASFYQKIKEQDPNFSCMKDKDGKFYRIAYDAVMFLNMFDMVKPENFNKIKHNSSILYLYNRENPISDDKINQYGQTNTHIEVAKKNRMKKIDNINL